MKKFLLAGSVFVAFAFYSFHQRHGEASAALSPPSTTQNPTSSAPTSSSGSSNSSPTTQPMMATAGLKDGQYTGDAADAYYGLIQVKTTISSGKITDVVFLQYPNDRSTSVIINKQAMPYLKQEAIAAQSGQVDIISGATLTSQAFIESMASALSQAQM